MAYSSERRSVITGGNLRSHNTLHFQGTKHVSVGPYHFGKPGLRGMEKYKAQAARRIQKRIPHNNFTSVVNKMISMEHLIRACYDKEIDFSSEVLCWMMARDASFLLEFFRNYISPFQGRDGEISIPFCERFHPVFNPKSDNSIVITILKDVMKLDNQIPLFVLEELLAVETNSMKTACEELEAIMKMVLGNIYRPFDFYFFPRSPRRSHILEMYHYSCLGIDLVLEAQNSSWSTWTKPADELRLRLPSAVNLKNAGVKFRADAGGLELVKFDKKTSVLSLPLIILNVESEVFISNLIALEMCSPRYKVKKFTQYAQFMDDLVHNQEDVGVMREHGIFAGNLRSYNRLVKLWSSSNLSPSISQCPSIIKTRNRLHNFYGKKWNFSCKIMWSEFAKLMVRSHGWCLEVWEPPSFSSSLCCRFFACFIHAPLQSMPKIDLKGRTWCLFFFYLGWIAESFF